MDNFFERMKKEHLDNLNSMKQQFIKELWDNMIEEYFNRHPEAGLAWWQVPVEQQPEGFNQEMYNIFWDLTHKENKNESL